LIGDAIQENVEDIFMEDVDGSGFSLTIPALLIEKAAAEAIIAHADKKFSVIKLQA